MIVIPHFYLLLLNLLFPAVPPLDRAVTLAVTALVVAAKACRNDIMRLIATAPAARRQMLGGAGARIVAQRSKHRAIAPIARPTLALERLLA
jgi:hypothetical protein